MPWKDSADAPDPLGDAAIRGKEDTENWHFLYPFRLSVKK